MAKALNKSRIRDTKLVLVLCAILFIFSAPLTDGETLLNKMLDMIGTTLVGTCALCRLYCTAFLGGHKNQSLVTYGPFSVCRNPLYFCSFIGACGIAMITNHWTLIILLPLLFLRTYLALIKREETYLIGHFGETYQTYCTTTPRLIPNFRLYQVPETVPMYPEFIHKGLKDCLGWLCVFPLLELIQEFQRMQVIPTYFTLP